MTKRIPRLLLRAGGCLLIAAALATAHAKSDEQFLKLAGQVQRQILRLPDFGVYDSISFRLEGPRVVLLGYASRPSLKKSAERAIRKIEGVEEVDNRIEVLPLSGFDDDIRAAAYARIYGHPALRRYKPGRGMPPASLSQRLFMGISSDPPQGYHPIHIIVKNGNLTLEGVVDSKADKTIAEVQARSVPGVFSFVNKLQIGGER